MNHANPRQGIPFSNTLLNKGKRGLVDGGKGDLMLIRNKIGRRVFVLACHVAKRPITAEEWIERSRIVARNAAAAIFEASDCAVLLRIKKSKERTYDALSFHRLVTKSGSETQ